MKSEIIKDQLHIIAESQHEAVRLSAIAMRLGWVGSPVTKRDEEGAVEQKPRKRGYKRSCDVEGCTVVVKGQLGLGIHKALSHGLTKQLSKQQHLVRVGKGRTCDLCQGVFKGNHGLALHKAMKHKIYSEHYAYQKHWRDSQKEPEAQTPATTEAPATGTEQNPW